jgi:hypothetical protein
MTFIVAGNVILPGPIATPWTPGAGSVGKKQWAQTMMREF